MRVLIAALILALVALPAAGRKKKKKELQWEKGVIAEVIPDKEGPARPAPAPGTASVAFKIRDRFEIQGGGYFYTVERRIVREQSIRLPVGTPIEFAEDGKKLILRTGRKDLKFRIVSKTPQ